MSADLVAALERFADSASIAAAQLRATKHAAADVVSSARGAGA
jgi:hypothetical protein